MPDPQKFSPLRGHKMRVFGSLQRRRRENFLKYLSFTSTGILAPQAVKIQGFCFKWACFPIGICTYRASNPTLFRACGGLYLQWRDIIAPKAHFRRLAFHLWVFFFNSRSPFARFEMSQSSRANGWLLGRVFHPKPSKPIGDFSCAWWSLWHMFSNHLQFRLEHSKKW